MTLKSLFVLLVAVSVFAGGCSSEPEKKDNDQKAAADLTTPSLVKFNGKMFSVPSPFQVAFLVKETNIPFNGDLLNATENQTKYLTEFQKGMNLGIYGTNLGYLTVYDQLPQASKYFAAIKTLTQELHMDNVMDPDLAQRIEKNLDNRDSLLTMVSESYRNTDSYLMENQRTEVAVMILTGAWIETVYLLTQLAPETTDKQVLDRIGEQKYTLDNIIELLRPYYGTTSSRELDTLTEKLVDLATVFDGITIEYTYQQPIVDVKNKTTTITSTSKTLVSDYQLKTITEMVTDIRKSLIQ